MPVHISRLLGIVVLLLLIGCAAAEHSVTVVVNPYESVDWDRHERHHGNFHTHTTESDGKQDPAEVIDHYHTLGYGVLALTDHDKVTWPWTDFGRDPEKLGMVAVQGNELSSHHHTLSLFSNVANKNRDLEFSLKQIEEAGGISVLAHPGRYWRSLVTSHCPLMRFAGSPPKEKNVPRGRPSHSTKSTG